MSVHQISEGHRWN